MMMKTVVNKLSIFRKSKILSQSEYPFVHSLIDVNAALIQCRYYCATETAFINSVDTGTD